MNTETASYFYYSLKINSYRIFINVKLHRIWPNRQQNMQVIVFVDQNAA
jgi:hypothetical protein